MCSLLSDFTTGSCFEVRNLLWLMMIHLRSKELHITDQFKSFTKAPNGKILRKLRRNEKWAFLHPTPPNLDCDTDVHQETPTPDPLLKVTFSTWCGWDTTICGKHSSADFWLHYKAGRGNEHPGLTQSLLAGEISTQGTEMEKMRGTTETRQEIQCVKPSASHLPAFPYLLEPSLVCKLLQAPFS